MSGAGEIVDLPHSKLCYGPAVRSMAVDLDHVQLLRPVLDKLPPILVRQKPTGSYEVLDGRHRWEASQQEGRDSVRGIVLDLTEDEGTEAACRANLEHGLPWSLKDRKAMAERLASRTTWADSRIASCCGLSDKTVADLRPRQGSENPNLATPPTRTGVNGVEQPTPVAAAAGREKVAEEILANPTASDREIAKRTGVSRPTVSKTRDAVNAGADPVPSKLRGLPSQKDDTPPEPTIAEAMGALPTVWSAEPACKLSNAGREFGTFMDRFTRRNGRLFKVEAAAVHCPAALRPQAAQMARAMAEDWNEFAKSLEAPASLGVAK